MTTPKHPKLPDVLASTPTPHLLPIRVKGGVFNCDGNAFVLLGRVLKAGRRAGVPAEALEAIKTEATSGDFDHLVQTLMQYAEDAPEDDE